MQDSDVFFRRSLTLSDFGLPLPPTIGMASEAMDIFPYNAGIMLMNLPRLRLTYEKFLSFVLGNKNGLFFTNYGPQDQVRAWFKAINPGFKLITLEIADRVSEQAAKQA